MEYIFTSQRLGFRDWVDQDIEPFAKLCADPEVMEFFPSTLTLDETVALVRRIQAKIQKEKYGYFAVDRLEDGVFIGFIGITSQTYESPITPCIDIGWRLDKAFWGKGYATEGAKRCLEFAFDDMQIEEIRSVASVVNVKSINVMKKIGMKELQRFIHPALKGDARLEACVCYSILKHDFFNLNV